MGHLDQVLEGIHELEGQLAKVSHNSSKPRPVMAHAASAGASATKARSRWAGRKAHMGWSQMQRVSPDEVVRHRPSVCGLSSLIKSHKVVPVKF